MTGESLLLNKALLELVKEINEPTQRKVLFIYLQSKR